MDYQTFIDASNDDIKLRNGSGLYFIRPLAGGYQSYYRCGASGIQNHLDHTPLHRRRGVRDRIVAYKNAGPVADDT
eukprot:313428-Pleurochrysis_carterae.AAC.2